MIACLRGELFHKTSEKMIVDVNGVGYEVFFSQTTHNRLPDIGDEVFVHIYTDVKEDAINLYGFMDEKEKEMFLLLVSVSGIGPKLALNMLSGCAAGIIARAIMISDVATLVKLPGVGKKTAERLCVELKDKVSFIPVGEEYTPEPLESLVDLDDQRNRDVISALVNLGYPNIAARKAIEKVQKQVEREVFLAMSLEDMLRQALRALA